MAGIVKAVEHNFGLAAMAPADRRAAPADSGCINPNQTTPRKFAPITSTLDGEFFLHNTVTGGDPPDDDVQSLAPAPVPWTFDAPKPTNSRGASRDSSSCTASDPVRNGSRPDATTGTLIVSEFLPGQYGSIEMYNAAGTNANPIGSIIGNLPENGINRPYGISVGVDGTLYVANYNPNNVLVFPQGGDVPAAVVSRSTRISTDEGGYRFIR